MTAESLNYARQYLRKARDYLASAQDNLDLERLTPAAGDAIHAGISAKDAVVTALTGRTSKSKDHAKAAGELRAALSGRPDAPAAERALRELIALKGDVEYGTKVPTAAQATSLVRRARILVELTEEIIDGR
ncbi:hypothetical protein [Nocardioides sp.]|uniref:hypothetical protein n=1 Tax=Nocardioides sp. TaxID=35761 RepID=UPI002BAE62C9|nr:hypothetical protein [Nocardioides sp.]HVX54455.1 hypothetical protein [Nocardioides sp.]